MKTSIRISVANALKLLTRRDKLILGAATILQMLLSLLDLAGVLVLGLVAASAAGAATGVPLSASGISIFSDFLPTDIRSTIVLAFVAAILLVSKSVFSLFLTRRIFRFIANRQAMIAGNIAERLLSRPLLDVQARSSQETTAALTTGINAVTIGTLGPSIVVGSEFALVLAMGFGLILIDPLVALFTVIFFGVITLLLQLLLGNWAQGLGLRTTEAEIGSMESMQNALNTYREVSVSGRRVLFISDFKGLRWQAARVQADTYVLYQVGKYVFEVSLIVGGGLLVLLMAGTRDITAAVAIITVFLASSSRIFPSLMRMQTSLAKIRESAGTAEYTYRLVDDLDAAEKRSATPPLIGMSGKQFNEVIHAGYEGFKGHVDCANVTVTYPGASRPALNDVSFSILAGKSAAFVGTTGSGKTTLVDIIMGLIQPESGRVQISGQAPIDAIQSWPGAIAYVPQDIKVIAGSVRQNVALGIPPNEIDDDLVWEALERAHLADFLSEERLGIDTQVGEHGVQISGGQRQRLGIARGLYSRPRFLVLDEATSALDAETEQSITKTLETLTGQVTLLVVAHRLATIRNVDQVIYLNQGLLVARGTFEEVRSAVPDFDSQARTMGIST
jgi:ABC-type multidrug transport system fused ATPase/permease subunit